MKDASVLEQQVTLTEILDPDSLQRVCMTFARMYGSGLSVVDCKGQMLVDIPAQYQLCRRISSHPSGHLICDNIDRMILNEEVEHSESPVIQSCACGLSYQLLAIRHQGTMLGRLIFGPHRAAEVEDQSEDLARILTSDNPERDAKLLVMVKDDLERMTIMSSEEARQAIRSIGEVLSVIVQTSYARHLTSQIHIAAIQEAYNELTEKNRRLADSVEKLKDLDKMKSNFLATVSHELRTPLTSVIGYSEMLIEGLAGDLSNEQKDYIKIIMEKGDQLLQIITEVLDISKIETGNVQLSCEWVKVADLVVQICDAMMPQARSKELLLKNLAPETLPPVWIDRAKARQVLLNLVSNAIKFTPQNGTVTVKAERSTIRADGASPVSDGKPAILISVQDSGIGIPEADRSKVFEAFFQVDSSSTREFGGTGLGLSIVKNFVEAHGGQVWVEPGKDVGTIFKVHFPLNPASAAAGQPQRSQSAG